MIKVSGLAVVLSAALVLPAGAQWLNYPTPGIPRTADGNAKSFSARASDLRR